MLFDHLEEADADIESPTHENHKEEELHADLEQLGVVLIESSFDELENHDQVLEDDDEEDHDEHEDADDGVGEEKGVFERDIVELRAEGEESEGDHDENREEDDEIEEQVEPEELDVGDFPKTGSQLGGESLSLHYKGRGFNDYN